MKYFCQYFQVFSIFTYNKSLTMKSYQLFRLCKRFYKEKEKALIQQSMRIVEKLGKVGLFLMIGGFIKPYKMIIIFSLIGIFVHKIFIFIASSFPAQFLHFEIRMTQEIPKRKTGNVKLLVIANYNTHFKNDFDLLVMKVTQVNFLYWQNVHTWRLIKINSMRSLQFVVVPTLISWKKTPKVFAGYNDKIQTKNAEGYIYMLISTVERFNSLVFT